jgi:hypothetical protein
VGLRLVPDLNPLNTHEWNHGNPTPQDSHLMVQDLRGIGDLAVGLILALRMMRGDSGE